MTRIVVFRSDVLYGSQFVEHIEKLHEGVLHHTHADKVRARLAILTAQHVLPFWLDEVDQTKRSSPDYVEGCNKYDLKGIVGKYIPEDDRHGFLSILEKTPIAYLDFRRRLHELDVPMDKNKLVVIDEMINIGMNAQSSSEPVVKIELDPLLAQYRSVYDVPLRELPSHILQLAEGVLNHEVDLMTVTHEWGEAHELIGRHYGFDESEFSARASDVCGAAFEALSQALSSGPYDRQAVTTETTDGLLMGRGAAAGDAMKAYAGIFDGPYTAVTVDPERRRMIGLYDAKRQQAFWLWWLMDALPRAQEVAGDIEAYDFETMPFRDTVQAGEVVVGIVHFDEDGSWEFESEDEGNV